MKILIVHSYYQLKGGEDAVFKNEQALLRDSEEVRALELFNRSGLQGARQFLLSIWNVQAAGKLKKLITEFQPDVIHLHNIHFALGPLAVRTIKKARIPVVLTLHNYRLLCPSATLSYKGELFTDSVHSAFPWTAIRKKVYRDSLFQTFWLAFTTWFHKKAGTWKMIDRYIVLTEFAKALVVDSPLGIAPGKVFVKPNFKDHTPAASVKRGKHFLFAGRLSAEKGIHLLLTAFAASDYELHIAGDGPLKQDVLNACRENSNIKFLGSLDQAGVEKAMQQCTALIFPSVWYEGMPMTLIEAFATGTPVIAGNLGAMASMIQDGYNGLHYQAHDATALAGQLNAWQQMTDTEQNNFRKNALDTYRAHYTPEKNKKLLLNIYKHI